MSIKKDSEKGSIIEPVVSFTTEDLEDKRPHVLTTIISPGGKEVKITNDVDQAMKFVLDHKGEVVELDEKEAKKLLRKIDLFLLPVMCLLYCFQFMDKLTTSYASVMGLRTGLHMKGDMYSWTTSAFYLGYLAFEFPASFLLQRFPVAKTVSVFIILWGMILALHSVPNYAGFVALRTILGALESSVTPAFTIITAQWYKKEEQFLRTSWWFASNGIGTIVGLAIAYGLYIHDGGYTLPAWKIVFIVTGVLTIFLGFIILFHIPDTPAGAWFLNDHEKVMVVERIRTNQQGFGNPHFKKSQFLEALTDHRSWLFVLFALSNNIPNGGLTSFGTILLNEDFGYAADESLLMQMPQGAVEIVVCVALAYCVRFISSRMLIGIFATAVALMAECLLAFAPQNGARLAGLYIYLFGPAGFICILSCIASNVAGHTKKVTTNAMYLIAYCVGNLVGPQTFIASQAPGYAGAKIAIVVTGSISLGTMVAIYLSYLWENKKRDSMPPVDMSHIENFEFADLTDKENPAFRYSI
ncbi:Allantoate permease [Candida viswanathii]|uniref:Allantoate permease n=1 Tax=Candida viswanathii TaxID=5486 RepID=A0A367YIA2_9ASCO|nr:Allantoate permease [Candida viswanathii]